MPVAAAVAASAARAEMAAQVVVLGVRETVQQEKMVQTVLQ